MSEHFPEFEGPGGGRFSLTWGDLGRALVVTVGAVLLGGTAIALLGLALHGWPE